MRIVVDRDLCESNGICVRAAPDLFVIDEKDVMQLRVERPSAAQMDAARAAVKRCPRRALSLVED